MIATRENWTNALVGLVDTAYVLTPVEVQSLWAAIYELLESLRIPNRGVPNQLPTAVVLEVEQNHYSSKFGSSTRNQNTAGSALSQEDADVWYTALSRQLTLAYPDLSAVEKLTANVMLARLVGSVQSKPRAVHYTPQAVTKTKYGL